MTWRPYGLRSVETHPWRPVDLLWRVRFPNVPFRVWSAREPIGGVRIRVSLRQSKEPSVECEFGPGVPSETWVRAVGDRWTPRSPRSEGRPSIGAWGRPGNRVSEGFGRRGVRRLGTPNLRHALALNWKCEMPRVCKRFVNASLAKGEPIGGMIASEHNESKTHERGAIYTWTKQPTGARGGPSIGLY